YSFAEASTLSTPWLQWMNVNEGDPLYTPMAPRTPVKDTTAPVVSAGFPTVTAGAQADEAVISAQVNDTPEPEVVRAQVDYGVDTSYGNSANSGPIYRKRQSIGLSGLQGGTVYHYRLTLTDPVGNITTTGDGTFTVDGLPDAGTGGGAGGGTAGGG